MSRRASRNGDSAFHVLLECARRQGIVVYDSPELDRWPDLDKVKGLSYYDEQAEQWVILLAARLKKDKQERALTLAHEIAHYLISHVLGVPFDRERYWRDRSYRERKEAEAEDGARWLLRVFGAEVAGELRQPNQPIKPQRAAGAAV